MNDALFHESVTAGDERTGQAGRAVSLAGQRLPRAAASPPATNVAHVLLVEDNPGDALLIRNLLREQCAGTTMRHVTTLAAAIDSMRVNPPDAALLDLSLPDASGWNGVQALHQAHPNVPIVVLTGWNDQQQGIESLQRGAQDFLVKGTAILETDLGRIVRYAVERKRADLIEQQGRALRETVQSMQDVLGIVGHELRTPLAAMRAMLELLTGDDDLGDEQRARYLDLMHGEVDRVSTLASQLLDSAQYNNSATPWHWTTFNMSRLCREVIESVRLASPPSDVGFLCEVEPGATVKGDSQAIRRLIINLLTNAVRHTMCGTIGLRAHGFDDANHRWMTISVHDTGEGIPEEIVSRLGRPFPCRGAGVHPRRTRGAGLGLAICRSIVDAHGGQMSLNTIPGVGTTFSAIMRADLGEPLTRPAGTNPKPILIQNGTAGSRLKIAA